MGGKQNNFLNKTPQVINRQDETSIIIGNLRQKHPPAPFIEITLKKFYRHVFQRNPL